MSKSVTKLVNEKVERRIKLTFKSLHAHGLGALDGQAKGARPDELADTAESSAGAEEDGVELLLGEAVVVEEGAGASIDAARDESVHPII